MSNQYLWNAGLFIWKVSTVLDDMKEFMPDTYQKLMTIQESIGTDTYQEVLDKSWYKTVELRIYEWMKKSQSGMS